MAVRTMPCDDIVPFTFSHPALVLPLAKYSGRYLSLTGLIIGSLCPDFEYFFRMKVESLVSHTVGGLFYFNLPTGIFLAFVFHNLIRNSFYNNLSPLFHDRFVRFTTFNWNNYFRQHYLAAIISILIGAASHLLWDGFTHSHGYFVQKLELLQQTINTPIGTIPVYKILQHLSTIIGGLVILLAFFRLPTVRANNHKINTTYWLVILLVSSTIITLRFTLGADKVYLGSLISTSLSAGVIALTLTPALLRTQR